MIRNQILAFRPGAPDPSAPPAVPIVQEDAAATRDRMRENMLQSGHYEEWEITAGVPAPAGAYAPAHPSDAIKAGQPLSGR
jgi:hypothetical protein